MVTVPIGAGAGCRPSYLLVVAMIEWFDDLRGRDTLRCIVSTDKEFETDTCFFMAALVR
jgi:hypothetical protein